MLNAESGTRTPDFAPSGTLARARLELVGLLAAEGIAVSPGEIRDVEASLDAHLAVPLFRPAKEKGCRAEALAEATASRLDLTGTFFESALPVRGYLNLKFHLGRFSTSVVEDFRHAPEGYGRSLSGQGRTIVIDYSSPNVAKPFSVGHLRSTIIGQALHNIFTWLGYRVIGDNHLGDWGTQFGKLLCAYNRWGSEAELATDPTRHLLELYVRFHEAAAIDPGLESEAREWFRRLETGDSETKATWQRFVSLSTAEFQRIYDLLGVRFDAALGESYYQDKLESVVSRALELGVAREEVPEATAEEVATGEKVVLIPLDSAGIKVPLLLRKSDGTSLYATREIVTAEYRIQTWSPDRILYVVGNDQELYFRQFNAALQLLGYDTPCIHVSFGLVRLPEGRMSTRAGRVVLLEAVIEEAIRRASAIVADRDLPDETKERVARIVGIGAIKYADLSQSRVKEVVFNWDKMLALDGDSAPYLQYAHTRCQSILRKAGPELSSANPDPALLGLPQELALLRHIARFPDAVAGAAATCEPHRVANRLYKLTQDFSLFYNAVPVLKAETPDLVRTRLLLVEMTGTVLRLGLKLLGIEVPEQM